MCLQSVGCLATCQGGRSPALGRGSLQVRLIPALQTPSGGREIHVAVIQYIQAPWKGEGYAYLTSYCVQYMQAGTIGERGSGYPSADPSGKQAVVYNTSPHALLYKPA